MSLAELIEEILAQPGLHLGHRSVVRMKSFKDGYRYALWKSGRYDETDPYYGFQSYVEGRFNLSTSHGWDQIIAFMCPEEVSAFELTRKLWDEYRSQPEILNR